MIRTPLAVALLAASFSTHAVPFLETGDAGHLIGTAQTVGGGFDGLSGELAGTPVVPSSGDIDVFRLNLAAGLFTATVTATSGFDSALVLFNAWACGCAPTTTAEQGSIPGSAQPSLPGCITWRSFRMLTTAVRHRQAGTSGLMSELM